jgi:hypothetical protein
MTAVGKILVFINLIFSVIVGSLVVMIYTARTHWVDDFNKLAGRYQIAQASEQTYKKEVDRAQKDAEVRVKDAEARVVKAVGELKSLTEANDQLRRDLAEQAKKGTRGDAVATAGLKEIEKRQADVEKLRETLSEQTKANIKLVADANKMREDKVAAEIQLRSMTERANRLEGQLQDMTKELVRVRSGGGSAGRMVSGKNPPLEEVEGLIRNTDPGSGLVTVTIGSDAGLAKGQTLEVFRLSSVPHQSKYLGTIRILEVTATQAVGQPTGRMTAPPQAGDRVASHILGS